MIKFQIIKIFTANIFWQFNLKRGKCVMISSNPKLNTADTSILTLIDLYQNTISLFSVPIKRNVIANWLIDAHMNTNIEKKAGKSVYNPDRPIQFSAN